MSETTEQHLSGLDDSELLNLARAMVQEAETRLHESRALSDLRWRADQRGIKKWQETTGRTMTWPNRADLVTYLIDRLEVAEQVIDVAREQGKVAVGPNEAITEFHAAGLDLAMHIAAYDSLFNREALTTGEGE